MRVIQLVPTFSGKDAVGNDVINLDRILRAEGYESCVYAYFTAGVPDDVRVKTVFIKEDFRSDDLVIFHFAIGSGMTGLFAQLSCLKILVYHNVTPPHFFEPYNMQLAHSCCKGLQQARYLADVADRCLADSRWNKSDLRAMGYTCPIDVLPIIVPFDEYRVQPNQRILDLYAKGAGANVVFVGRVAPNKCLHDVIKAFMQYKLLFDSRSRLFLVGAKGNTEPYYGSLINYVDKLGVEDVYFTGSVPFEDLLAYYRIADVFLCQSEHEGFCVPLVEAMFFGVPVVAYDSTAIRETLGGGGVVLESKDAAETAAVIHRVITDQDLNSAVVSNQYARLEDFRFDVIKSTFLKIIEDVLRGNS